MMSKVDYNMRPKFFVRGWWCGDGIGRKHLHANQPHTALGNKRATNIYRGTDYHFFKLTKIQRISNKYYRVSIYTLNDTEGNGTYKVTAICEGRKMLKEKNWSYDDIPIRYGADAYMMGTDHTDFWRMNEAIDIRSLENFKTDYVDKFDLHHLPTLRLLRKVRVFYNDPDTPFGRIKNLPQ